jgi:hypothetical protein
MCCGFSNSRVEFTMFVSLLSYSAALPVHNTQRRRDAFWNTGNGENRDSFGMVGPKAHGDIVLHNPDINAGVN